MTHVKKIIVAAAVCVMISLCAVFAAGCDSSTGTVNAKLTDAPPVMQTGHEGRYQELGANGCYGCHGTNSQGQPMLKAAPSIPSSHLSVDKATSAEDIQSDHQLCITCHVPQTVSTDTTKK